MGDLLVFAFAAVIVLGVVYIILRSKGRNTPWRPVVKSIGEDRVQVRIERAGEPAQVVGVLHLDHLDYQDALANLISEAEERAIVLNAHRKALSNFV